jgi:hypothetical protein
MSQDTYPSVRAVRNPNLEKRGGDVKRDNNVNFEMRKTKEELVKNDKEK